MNPLTENPSEKMTFFEAKNTCDKYGGKLPVPKNSIVNQSFDSKLSKKTNKLSSELMTRLLELDSSLKVDGSNTGPSSLS